MSNTCCNEIRIEGSAKALRKIQNAASAAIKQDDKNAWNMPIALRELGFKDKDLQTKSIREDIYEVDTSEKGVLKISTESAWCFQPESWELIKSKFPSVSIYFLSEEFGCDVFCTNDTERRHFKMKYALDYSADDDCAVEYFDDDCSLIEFVHDHFDSTVGSFEEMQSALEEINDRGGDDYACLHTIDYETSFEL